MGILWYSPATPTKRAINVDAADKKATKAASKRQIDATIKKAQDKSCKTMLDILVKKNIAFYTKMCTKADGNISIGALKRELKTNGVPHNASKIKDTNTAQKDMIPMIKDMATLVANVEGMCNNLSPNVPSNYSLTHIRKSLYNAIKCIAAFIATNRRINSNRNTWKSWNHALCMMSRFTKFAIIFSRKPCHAQLKRLLTQSESEDWLASQKDCDHIVYAIVNHTTGKSYIGRTSNKNMRRQQHLHSIYKGTRLTAKTYRDSKDSAKKLYRFACKHKPFQWALIPFDCTHGLAIGKLEKQYIKRYKKVSSLNNTPWLHKVSGSNRRVKALRNKKFCQTSTTSAHKAMLRPKDHTTMYKLIQPFGCLETPLLNSILEHIRRNIKMGVQRSYRIYITQGHKDFSNYTSIRRRFSSESIHIHGEGIHRDIPLSALQSYISKNKIMYIDIDKLKTSDNKTTWANTFQELLETPKKFSSMSMEDLIWHYFKANILMYKQKKMIRSKIRHQLKTRFKLLPLDHIIMKLPTNNYNRRTIYRIMKTAIYAYKTIPAYLQNYLIKSAKIVLTKRSSILDILNNNIKLSKGFGTKKTKCCCTHIKKNIPECTLLHGHCIQKYLDLPKPWAFMDSNLKNIPVPGSIDTKRETEKGLKEFINSTLYKFHPHKFSNAELNKYIPIETPCSKDIPLPKPIKVKIKPVMWDLFSGISSVSKYFEKRGWIVRSFGKDPKLAKNNNSICTCVLKYDFKT